VSRNIAAAGSVQSLGFLLGDVLRLMRADFRRSASGLNLTPALARLLLYVDQKPGCSQTELANYLDVTTVTIGRMISRLENCGYVSRVADAVDRRAVRVYVGKSARPLLGRMNRLVAMTTEHATRGLNSTDLDALTNILSRMRVNLSASA
jgi:DNA-binding MarR family transcriptional regulator